MSDGVAGAERDEWNAAIGDSDMTLDTDRQFRSVEVSMRRWELRRAELMQQEEALRREVSDNFRAVGARDQLRLDAQLPLQQVQRLDVGRMKRDIERAEQQLEATSPPPGLAHRARLVSLQQDGSVQNILVVPSGGELMSMFQPGFWSASDPLSFPYGTALSVLNVTLL